MNRREFGKSLLASAALASVEGFRDLRAEDVPVLRLEMASVVKAPRVSRSFTGLSYETAQLADSTYFSPENAILIRLCRNLSPQGVLRLGGNTSDYARFTSRTGTEIGSRVIGPDRGGKTHVVAAVTLESLRNLRGFLDETGWTCIYGLDLGSGTPAAAANGAKAVDSILGRKLLAFQIGNEPNMYHHNGLRPKDYGYQQYAVEWRKFHAAVHARVPDAGFGGPDTGQTGRWLKQFAKDFGQQISFLSSHFYAEGPPSNPEMTIERFLSPSNPRSMKLLLPAIHAAQAECGKPYRLTEVNSCYKGGKPGVSDTFASALWAAELMLQMAIAGVVGVNFHGGGFAPYTPLAGNTRTGISARPEYYGILFGSRAAGYSPLEAKLRDNTQAPGVSAYAGRSPDGAAYLAIFNRSPSQGAVVEAELLRHSPRARRLWLTAPSLASKTGVTLGGASVLADGARQLDRSPASKSGPCNGCIAIPAASAVFIELPRPA